MKIIMTLVDDRGFACKEYEVMEMPKGATHFTVKPHGKNVSHDPVSFDLPRPTVKKWKWTCLVAGLEIITERHYSEEEIKNKGTWFKKDGSEIEVSI